VSGFADIAAGSLTVGVHYSSLGAYPNIRIAPYGQVDGVWWIDSVTDSSFRIVFSQAQSHDVRFSWTAVPSQTGDYPGCENADRCRWRLILGMLCLIS
jgi:hypothetical protein